MPHLQPQHKVDSLQPQNSASPQDHNIDPAIAGGGMMSTSAGESGGDDNGAASDGRKGGKRELSTSKRAAQNRAAQVSASELVFSTAWFGWLRCKNCVRIEWSSRMTKSLCDHLCHQDGFGETSSLAVFLTSTKSSCIDIIGAGLEEPANF